MPAKFQVRRFPRQLRDFEKEAPKAVYATRGRVSGLPLPFRPQLYSSTARLPSTVTRLQRHKKKRRRTDADAPVSSHCRVFFLITFGRASSLAQSLSRCSLCLSWSESSSTRLLAPLALSASAIARARAASASTLLVLMVSPFVIAERESKGRRKDTRVASVP